MDHFAGLDVSVKETSVCIVDDTGRIGLPHEAMPVSKLQSGTIRCLTFDVRFGSIADIWVSVGDVRFSPQRGHRS